MLQCSVIVLMGLCELKKDLKFCTHSPRLRHLYKRFL